MWHSGRKKLEKQLRLIDSVSECSLCLWAKNCEIVLLPVECALRPRCSSAVTQWRDITHQLVRYRTQISTVVWKWGYGVLTRSKGPSSVNETHLQMTEEKKIDQKWNWSRSVTAQQRLIAAAEITIDEGKGIYFKKEPLGVDASISACVNWRCGETSDPHEIKFSGLKVGVFLQWWYNKMASCQTPKLFFF